MSEEGKVKGERNCRVRCGGWKDSEDGEGQNQTPAGGGKGWAPFVPRRRPGCENGNSHIAKNKGRANGSFPPRLNLNGIAASQHDGASRANTRRKGVIISDINDIRKLIGAAS